jgi:hypothetical protein
LMSYILRHFFMSLFFNSYLLSNNCASSKKIMCGSHSVDSSEKDQLKNAIQHLLWVLNYLQLCLPEQLFHQYEGGPRREEVQRLQQIVETFLCTIAIIRNMYLEFKQIPCKIENKPISHYL